LEASTFDQVWELRHKSIAVTKLVASTKVVASAQIW